MTSSPSPSSSPITRINDVVSHLSPSSTSSSSPSSSIPLSTFLSTELSHSLSFASVLVSISTSVIQVKSLLDCPPPLSSPSSSSAPSSSSVNPFGDSQIALDISTDKVIFSTLRRNPHIYGASSEENPTFVTLATPSSDQSENDLYCVSFDPLDGSSVIDCNFSVGSIFTLYKGKSFFSSPIGNIVVGAVVAIYGPRTTLFVSYLDVNNKKICHEFTYSPSDSSFILTKNNILISDSTNYFSPANLRSAKDFPPYRSLLSHYIDNKYTLRYTGSMAPDITQQLVKKGGIFISPTSHAAKAKLRMSYEIVALAFLIESVGGEGRDEKGQRILDKNVTDFHGTCGAIIGSKEEVQRYVKEIHHSANVTPQSVVDHKSNIVDIVTEEDRKYLSSIMTSHPDFPRPGVLFFDVLPIFRSPPHAKLLLSLFSKHIQTLSPRPSHIIGLESRGFLFGPTLSFMLDIPFVPIRKKGKLPGKVEKVKYQTEYSLDEIEIQVGTIKEGDEILIVDDLLATGGTMGGAIDLVRKCGSHVLECAVIVELVELKGKEKFADVPCFTIFKF